jgi:OOP family OmpA-OmpF porin
MAGGLAAILLFSSSEAFSQSSIADRFEETGRAPVEKRVEQRAQKRAYRHANVFRGESLRMHKYIAPALSVTMFLVPAVLSGCHAEAVIGTPPQASAAPSAPPTVATAAPTTKPIVPIHFKIKKKGNQLDLPGPVVFKTGSDVLEPQSDEILTMVEQYMKAEPKVSLLRIEGHTDNDGTAAANQALSEKRAMAVAKWEVAHGVDCKRMLPVGFGQDKPVAQNTTAEGKAQNRRVEFHDAAIEGKAIAGLPVDGGGKTAGDPCK